MEVYMSLMNHLKGKAALGVVLCFILFLIIFGFGKTQNCKGQYCFFGPNKQVTSQVEATVETCQAEEKVEAVKQLEPVQEIQAVR
jgi:hypothetical protein